MTISPQRTLRFLGASLTGKAPLVPMDCGGSGVTFGVSAATGIGDGAGGALGALTLGAVVLGAGALAGFPAASFPQTLQYLASSGLGFPQ